MAQTFDVDGPAVTPREAINIVKVRDEISRLSQRLTRARQSYDSDLVRGEGDVPLDVQLATIEGYTAKLEVLYEQLRVHEGGEPLPAAQQTGPQPLVPTPSHADLQAVAHAAVEAAVQSVPSSPPLPHRVAPQLPEPQAAAPQTFVPQPPAPPPSFAPQAVFQPEPVVFESLAPLSGPTPQAPRTFDTSGNTLISDATLRSEEVATGEYVRLAAEQRWLATHRPSIVSEYIAACELILEALAHWHGTTPQVERDRLVRHVDARFRRDYG